MRRLRRLSSPVSIVMVAYNEESTIEGVLREYYRDVFVRLPKGSEYILYLDKPSDKTASVVFSIAKEIPLKVILGNVNLGYAGAMKNVLRKAKNNIIFYSDSSGKHKGADFWNLIQHIRIFDIVTGDRTNRSDPLLRQILTFFQRFLVVFLFRVPFYDYNTGFKVVKKDVIEQVLEECRYTKQSFSTEFMIRAMKKGFSVANIPVRFTKRTDARAGITHRQLPRIIFINLRGMFFLWKEFSGI